VGKDRVNPYERFSADQLMLRDQLAMDRTVLANERTLLAYIRTGLALALGGVGSIKFFHGPYWAVAGVVLIFCGVVVCVFGVGRYLVMDRIIRRARRGNHGESHSGQADGHSRLPQGEHQTQ